VTAPPAEQPSPAHDSLVDPQRRSANLDVLRAIAALMVLCCHAYLLGVWQQRAHEADTIFTMRWSITALLGFAASGVWLFFALSGYLITKPFVRSLVTGEALPRLLPYGVRRGARIYPLYWVVLVATTLVLGSGVIGSSFPAVFLLGHNLVPKREDAVLAVAWTLTIEMLFYLLVPVAALLLRKALGPRVAPARLATIVGFVFVLSTLWTCAAVAVRNPEQRTWLQFVLPGILAMFCPGILLAIAEHPLDGSHWRTWLVSFPRRRFTALVAVAAIVGAALLHDGVSPSDGPYSKGLRPYHLSRPLYALGYGLLLAWALRAPGPRTRLWERLAAVGLISYGIYLIHFFVVTTLRSESWGEDVVPLPHGGLGAYLVHVAFLLVLTLPLAWLSWHAYERPVLTRAIALVDRRRDRA
jgi:peptidoglycan/LPS O-acetylase OafA/YrhL